MKYGDWHKTKEIILKGHDWVRERVSSLEASLTSFRLFPKSKLRVSVAVVVLVSLLD